MKQIILLLVDITQLAVDALVNSANESMLGGSGLSYCIHKKAGKVLQDACKELNQQQAKYPVGTALITPAGELHAIMLFMLLHLNGLKVASRGRLN